MSALDYLNPNALVAFMIACDTNDDMHLSVVELTNGINEFLVVPFNANSALAANNQQLPAESRGIAEMLSIFPDIDYNNLSQEYVSYILGAFFQHLSQHYSISESETVNNFNNVFNNDQINISSAELQEAQENLVAADVLINVVEPENVIQNLQNDNLPPEEPEIPPPVFINVEEDGRDIVLYEDFQIQNFINDHL